MSYNIDSIMILETQDLRINAREAFLLAARPHELPKYCFLKDLTPEFARITANDQRLSEVELRIERFHWCGEGSGTSWSYICEKVAPHIKGRLRGLLVWEGGDEIEFLQIKDGVVRTCPIEIAFGPGVLDRVFEEKI